MPGPFDAGSDAPIFDGKVYTFNHDPLVGVPLPPGVRTAREVMAQTPPPKWRCTHCGAETDLVMRLVLSPDDDVTIQDGDWYRNGTVVFHCHDQTGYHTDRVE